MQHYQLQQEKIKYFIVWIGAIFVLTINMCDRGRTIKHLQILGFHTQVWYNRFYSRFRALCDTASHDQKLQQCDIKTKLLV